MISDEVRLQVEELTQNGRMLLAAQKPEEAAKVIARAQELDPTYAESYNAMGAVLMTAGTKGKRSALQHSRIMIHQPMGGAQGQASDIEITAREIMKLKKELYQIIADHSGNSIKKVEKDSDRDYWMTAAEAKEYGMIDTVLIREHK